MSGSQAFEGADEPCGAGEATRPQTERERQHLPERNRDRRRHVLPSFGGTGYHTLCDGRHCEGSQDEDGLSLAERTFLCTQPGEAWYLVAEEEAFVGFAHVEEDGYDGKVLALNMGDTFFYACADAETLRDAADVGEVARIYRHHCDGKQGRVVLTGKMKPCRCTTHKFRKARKEAA